MKTNANTTDVRIIHEETDGGEYIRYQENLPFTQTQKWVTVWRGDLAGAAFTARAWHSGQTSALYRLTCEDYSFDTLVAAERELVRALARANVSEAEWLEAQSALETIQQVTHHFAG